MSLAAPALSGAATSLRLGATPTGILVWLADGLGLLGGLDLQIIKYTSGTKTAKDLVQGELDLATSSEFAFVTVSFDRPDLRILSSLSQSRTIDVFARADRGITGYADLAGKTIGVVQNSFAHFALHSVLLEHDVQDVTMVPLLPLDIVKAITAGEVDAGVVWDPYLRQVELALGDQFVRLPHRESHDYQFVLHGAADWIADNKAITHALVGKLVEASQHAEDAPQDAKRIVGKRLGLDAETMDYLWPKHTLRLSLSQALLRLMEDEAWFRVDLGLSSGEVPNYLDLISAGALRAVDPGGVSIRGLS